MLKKLLKYDLKAMFRYWWIAALTTVVFGVAGGFILSSMVVSKMEDYTQSTLLMLGLMLIMIGFSAFSIMTLVVIFARFYKNLFTDEGYLTFTLPVKRRDIINSKLLGGVITYLATAAVIALDVIITLLIGLRRTIFTAEFLENVSEVIKELFKSLGAYTIVYLVEFLVIGLMIYFIWIMFLYCCITIGSIIVKKAKVIASVGIFYGAYSVCTFVMQILMLFSVPSVSLMLGNVPDTMYCPLFALALLIVIFIQAAIFTLLYVLQYFMLDRKLNLN